VALLALVALERAAYYGARTTLGPHLRLELGKTLIANILFAHGVRRPARRPGRSRDEHALRGAFETFFAGAQWVADGKQVEVVIDGEVLHVNLELVVDAATDAAVGIDVRAVSVGTKIEGLVVTIIEGVDQANRGTLGCDAARSIQKGIASSSGKRSRSRMAL